MRRERGYLLVWFAVMMTTLIASAGFALDLGYRVFEDSNAQRAADAAALAGVVYRGAGGDDALACEAAFRVAAVNGYVNDDEAEDICDGPASARVRVDLVGESQLRVTIRTTAPALLSRAIGIGDSDMYRDATAAFDSSVAMGSPVNVLGNEPLTANEESWLPDAVAAELGDASMWLDVHGPRSYVHGGDQFSSNDCSLRESGDPVPDPCYSTSPDNADYLEEGNLGQYYVIHVPNPAPPQLEIQLYDPTFTALGAACRKGQTVAAPSNSYLAVLYAWVDYWAGGGPIGRPAGVSAQEFADFAERYTPTALDSPTGGEFCAGDDDLGSDLGGGGGGGGAVISGFDPSAPLVAEPATFYSGYDGSPVTEFTVLAPEGSGGSASTPGDRTDNAPVAGCQDSYGWYWQTDLLGQFMNNTPDRASPLSVPGALLDHGFRDAFQRWVSLCTIDDPEPGDYYLRVRTNAAGDQIDGDGFGGGQGGNRFAIRAGNPQGSSGDERSAGIRVAADQRMTLAANVASGNEFFLAQVPPAGVDRTLAFTFFDPGDLAGCRDINVPSTCAITPQQHQVTLTLGRRTESGFVDLGNVCRVWKPDGEPLAGFPSTRPDNPGPCAITNLSSATNGALLRVEVDLPSSNAPNNPYDCAPSPTSPFDCWIKVQFSFDPSYTGGFQGSSPSCAVAEATSLVCIVRPSDTTTWTAELTGSPARLVE